MGNARDSVLPFERGVPQTDAGAFDHLLGREYTVEDIDLSAQGGTKPNRSGKYVTLRLVKNGGTVAHLPSRLVAFSATAGENGGVTTTYAAVTNQRAYPVDEYLPAAGAPVGSYYYVVVGGPAMVTTAVAGADFNGDIAVGDALNAGTAAASTGVTAGRVQKQNITASSQTTDYSAIINAAQNLVGRALSAATTGQTSTNILCEVGKF
jgi:hypothetical protein